MITTQYMTSFTPEEMKLMVEQGAAKDARIAELEAALAAAQERERAATLRGNWYEQWIEDATLEDYREQGEFEDDAKRMTERNMQSRRERMAEYVAAALAAAQPASDGGENAA